MPKTIRYTLLSLRDLWVSAGPFIVVALTLLVAAYWWLDPNPPKRVTLATGPAQSAYEEFGKRYATLLAKDGIEVMLLPSQGSAHNLQLLREGKADLGFVQGGTSTYDEADAESLTSLGSLFVEPLWLFYREELARRAKKDSAITSLVQLQGLRINLGTPGSGVPNLMGKLLESNRIEPASLKVSNLDQTPATVAFLNGELDAIVFASAPESLMVQMLLQTPGVKLMNFTHSEAYSKRFSFLSTARLPQGVVDLARNVPAEDVNLVAPTTSLIARTTTHPALVQLFAQAGNVIHGPAGWFKAAREFPNRDNSELPISKEAERAIKNDAPLLQRYLPFWVANLVERMWLVMGIIIAVMLPLSRIVPPLYEFRVRSRIFRWYGQLRDIENRIAETQNTSTLLDELNALEGRAEKISVPLSYTDELYALRSNIHLVRKKLQRLDAPSP
ncbi:MAG: TAXI family TRAP transporter solute-binding subunit [Polaromonas sp.]|uniref:TAXI family TRAP transporter solute-binding subunit n=1 Tax=Comamonadaceae TaxID=80864 RepID=UPI0027317DDC|nr:MULTISPECIES: TAXI family TRAP transporter solute-binding subunit [Comamonadaceae]MDP1741641.1 TAXI family TRAP transporter solute-binding subunit [Polaromonas sp.]MDP1943053.1 TAXI family TRAP transporter solute-binding subunit [Rhodoferax sp.]MDP3356008.1 TAXI family TRAP transporter solute-binding subunit [Polaromonas sp.]MDP3752877.1 TAXI family TRAP transporter solute-binding subunit [Polaromonas sp.]